MVDLLLECDFVSLFLVEFSVYWNKAVLLPAQCFLKKNGKGEEKENSEDKNMDAMVSNFAALLKSW